MSLFEAELHGQDWSSLTATTKMWIERRSDHEQPNPWSWTEDGHDDDGVVPVSDDEPTRCGL
jgi:hypothetical protein